MPLQPWSPLRAAFAPETSLSYCESKKKNVPFSLLSATCFPRSNISVSRVCLGLGPEGGLRAALGARLWVVPGHWGCAMAVTGGRWRGRWRDPFLAPKHHLGFAPQHKGMMDGLAQAQLVAPALRARGPGMFAWAPGAVSQLGVPVLLQAGSRVCLERVKSCPRAAP